nr:ABC transporter ATP-binding protein [uncultured Merdimonas sp.]
MELCIKDLTKQYQDKLAADHVNLTITPGIWGLLGANGAGKTTLMRMAAGLLKPTRGTVEYDGIPIEALGKRYRNIFGYLPQEFGFYPEFTVYDYLDYVAALKGLSRKKAAGKIDRLLETFSLTEVRKKRITKLSGGMKRRVGIAQALLNDPEVLILDEPTSGLDPGERVRFRNLLSEFAADRIVLISTHIVSDVEYIASHNAMMKDGRIIAEGATGDLLQEMDGKVWSAVIPESDVHRYEQKVQIVNIRNEDREMVSVRYLSERARLPESDRRQPRLEDLYLWLFPQEKEVQS